VALADAGLRVTVLEASTVLGGRARSWTHAASGDEIDIGPHIVHSEYANFLKLLARLGTSRRITWQPRPVLTLATSPTFRLSHLPLPPPLSLFPSLLRAPGLSLSDLASNSRATLRALQFGDEQLAQLDRVDALQFLTACGATTNMIDWFWRLAAMTTLNVPLERCSAAALLRVHAQISAHRGFHFGFAQIGLSDLYAKPALRAIEALGGRVVTHARVVRAEREGGAHVVKTADGRRFAARHVVYAVPPAELGALDATLADTRAFRPSPYKSVYLWFDRKITRERFWSLMWSPMRLNYDFYDVSNIRPASHEKPSLIASNIIYSHRAARMTEKTIVARTLDELASFVPAVRAARLLHADVHHIPMAIPCPHPGTECKRPRTTTSSSNIFLAGDWTFTQLPSSMESAARSGYLAAEAVLAAEGRRMPIAIAPREYDAIAGWIRRRAKNKHETAIVRYADGCGESCAGFPPSGAPRNI
jgi:15-cis-phytoene desaturase